MEKSGSITGIRRIAVFASVVLFSVLLGGCGGGGGGGGDGGGSDTTPDVFSFTDRADVPLSAPIASNAITVSGINAAAPISVTDGEYAINGGSYTSTAGTVTNGQTVTVRQTSSSTASLTTTATLTIGGVSASFNVTTCNFDYSGLYNGSGTVNTASTLAAVHGMWRNERFILFDVGQNVLYDGTVQSYSSTGEITGTVNVYKDGVNSQQASITGTATNDATHPTGITVNLAGAGYGAGSITLSYSAAYHTKWATVDRFSAVFPDGWLGTINTVTSGTSMSLLAPITGNTFTGGTGDQVRCNYENGTKTIPNATVNLYLLSFNSVDAGYGNCNHVGTNFTGFATVVDNGGPDNLMWFAATNGTYSNFSLMDYYVGP